MLVCSIKSFLSINVFNLELSVKVIKLKEYVHYEYRSYIVQEKSIENFADFLMSFNYSVFQPFFKHSLSLFFPPVSHWNSFVEKFHTFIVSVA